MCKSCYLQFSESIVTFLLTWGLLSAHGDELVDAVCNCPENTKIQTWLKKYEN